MQRLSGQPHCGISTYPMSALGRAEATCRLMSALLQKQRSKRIFGEYALLEDSCNASPAKIFSLQISLSIKDFQPSRALSVTTYQLP
jgi:hypothetical protein